MFPKKKCIWNPIICPCETGEYLGSIVNVSVATWDEIIDDVAKSYDEPPKNQKIKFGKGYM